MAMAACEISRVYNISIFSALFGYFDLKPMLRKNLKALETHFLNMKKETPEKAIYRIVHFMGYREYMERNGLRDSKIFLMKNIAEREENIENFLGRMEELKDIIQNKKNYEKCSFILSTIHGSKGLEYDNVFLIDVKDGIFPEEIPKDLKHASKEEIESYEEERRLFYVGITRAKQNLYIFKTGETSTFTNQLLNTKQKVKTHWEKPIPQFPVRENYPKTNKTAISEKSYLEFLQSLSLGDEIIHKKIGKGKIISVDETNIKILFEGIEKKFNSKFLYTNQLLRKNE